MSKRITPEKLTAYCVLALTKLGMREKDAGLVADVLVTTDTWGTFSHGTNALGNYIKTMQAGGIDPLATPELVGEGEAWAVIDGHSAMGMLGSSMAMDLAIEKARKTAIAWVGVRNSSHFGAAGYYANMAAKQDMIGLAMSNADPNMVIPGGRGHIIGNNPMAYAIPVGDGQPLFLDIALSAVAAGKIFAMKAAGKPIPDTWLTDKDGLPVVEVGDWPNSGSMVPMAGHKGYGIALLIEVLAGALTGAGRLSEVKSWIHHPTAVSRLGQSFIAMNIGNIVAIDIFKQRIDGVIAELHASPKAKGSERVYVPGEIEWEKRADALANGIPLPEAVFASLYQAGQKLGIETRLLD